MHQALTQAPAAVHPNTPRVISSGKTLEARDQWRSLPPVEMVRFVSRRISRQLQHATAHSFTAKRSPERNQVACIHRHHRRFFGKTIGVRGYV